MSNDLDVERGASSRANPLLPRRRQRLHRSLAIYSGLIHIGLHYLPVAALAFTAAFLNNYTLNRHWTFQTRAANVYDQGARYLVLSLGTLGGNLLLLHWLVSLHADKLIAQATAVVLMTPLNFLGSKLWAFANPHRHAAA